MIGRIAALLLLFATCMSVAAAPRDEAVAAYQKFFQLFTTDNQDEVTALFAPDALFYGTSSTDLAIGHVAIRAYFVGALTGARGTVRATPFEHTTLDLSDSVIVITGKWQSERTLNGTMTTAGPSRNSVVLQKQGDRWLIVQFHSSATPKPPGAAPAGGAR